MAVNVNPKSRLRFYQLITLEDYEFWNLDELPEIPIFSDDVLYQVKTGDRIDMISNVYYGTPHLWWVIAAANSLELLPAELNDDLVLRIPSPTYVKTQLFIKSRF